MRERETERDVERGRTTQTQAEEVSESVGELMAGKE